MKKRIISAVAVVAAAIGSVVTFGVYKNKKAEISGGKEMSGSKLKEVNKKIAEGVTGGYKKIEDGVVGGYKKIEDGVVGGYKKIEDGAVGAYKKVEDKFVDKFLKHDGESIEDAKERLKQK